MCTCGFCGRELSDSYCSYCSMKLQPENIQKDGNRKNHVIRVFPSPEDYLKSTVELIQFSTIELLYLLHEARTFRTEVYHYRILGHKAISQSNNSDMKALQNKFFHEYADATRKVWVIENIIKDRIGYFPQKISQEFLTSYQEKIKQSQSKKMIIKQSK
ncbi:hypothetical protein D7Z54_29850 [Salibacterium salarium]|uniref:Uncharacterized protein n=1 Tax=Salibacterium salarium TaxID=284579 RepID=A0A428MU88_9BACI|nr:hypothetical protein D7Z54_29850 [Salibacterium salarium]